MLIAISEELKDLRTYRAESWLTQTDNSDFIAEMHLLPLHLPMDQDLHWRK